MRADKQRGIRRAGVFGGGAIVTLVLLGAVAFACTAHTGNIWFCSSSSGCSFALRVSSPNGNSSAYWVDGSALIPNRSDISIRYALVSAGADACHTGSAFATGGVTDSLGNLTPVNGTTPAPGNYEFCAINGTNTNFSGHLSVTLQ